MGATCHTCQLHTQNEPGYPSKYAEINHSSSTRINISDPIQHPPHDIAINVSQPECI